MIRLSIAAALLLGLFGALMWWLSGHPEWEPICISRNKGSARYYPAAALGSLPDPVKEPPKLRPFPDSDPKPR